MNQDKSNELIVLSDQTTTSRRYIMDRFDRKNISEEDRDKFLQELSESHNKKLLEILTKYQE